MLKACILTGVATLGITGFAWGAGCCGAADATECKMPSAMAATTQPTTKPASETYVCPMGCEKSDKPGKCSKCGMDLVKKEAKSKSADHANHAH